MTDQGGVERIGLDAYMGTSQFEDGMKTYLGGLDKMSGVTDSVAFKMTRGLGTAAAFLGDALYGVDNAGSVVTNTFGKIGLGSIALGAFLGKTLYSAVTKVTKGFYNLAAGGLMSAARAEQMDFVLQVLGSRFGKTDAEMDQFVDSVVDLGIRMDVAQDTIAQMARYQVDFAKATDLARAAQDTAIIANEDSSNTLQRFVQYVQTGNTQLLQTAGILVNTQDAYKKLAGELDKNVNSLTEEEKAQARVNAVLLEAEKNAGLYEASMQTAGKQLASLTGREIPELGRVIGTEFVPALFEVVKGAREVTSTFTEAVDEGGVLHDELTGLGAAAAVAGEGFRDFAVKGVQGIISFINNGSGKLAAFAEKAFTYGINIASQLAMGIVEGAASALIAAMNFISNILSSWLSPGSPPRVAKNLDKWGAEAMTLYIKSWTKGDFSAFDELSGTIEKYLRGLPKDIGKEGVNLIPTILGSREAIAQAINEVKSAGEVTDKAIDKIFKKAKYLSAEFRDYIKVVLETEIVNSKLAEATEEVADREKYLDTVTRRLSDAQDELNTVKKFYDDILDSLTKKMRDEVDLLEESQRLSKIETALASGLLTKDEQARLEAEKRQILYKQQIRSVEEQRDAQVGALQEGIDAIEAERQAAEERLQMAQDEEAALQQRLDTLQEQLDLNKEVIGVQDEQNKLIDQQMKLLEQLAQAAAAAGGSISDALENIAGFGAGGGPTKTLDTLFEDMKTKIKDKIAGIFDPIKTEWEEKVGPKLEEFKGAWETFSTTLKTYYDEKIAPAISWAKEELFPPGTIENIGKFAGAVAVAAIAVGLLSLALGILTSPIFLIGVAIVALVVIWQKWGDKISEFFAQTAETAAELILIIQYKFNEMSDKIANTLNGIGETVSGWVEGGKQKFRDWQTNTAQSVRTWSDETSENIRTWVSDRRQDYETWATETAANIVTWYNDTKGTITTWASDTKAGISTWILDTKTDISDWVDSIKTWFEETLPDAWAKLKQMFVDPLVEGFDNIKEAIGNIIEKIGSFITKVLEFKPPSWLGWFLGHSPAPLAVGIDSISNALHRLTTVEMPALSNAWNLSSSPLSGGGTVINNQQYINMSMSPQYQQVQSPSSVYYDVSAALSTIMR